VTLHESCSANSRPAEAPRTERGLNCVLEEVVCERKVADDLREKLAKTTLVE
jgi:hypothetical protein